MTTEMQEILNMAHEYEDERPQRVPHYYRRNSQMVRRSYDDFIYSARHSELRQMIESHRCFRCCECGRMCSYFDLETWMCEFEDQEDGIICSQCYEDDMGEDL